MESKKTIDISLSWSAAINILIKVLQDGTPEGKTKAKAELRELANKLDRLTALNDAATIAYAALDNHINNGLVESDYENHLQKALNALEKAIFKQD